MADVTIKYKGNNIATMDDSGTKTMQTSGKYCESDIVVDYVKPSGGLIEQPMAADILKTPVSSYIIEANSKYTESNRATESVILNYYTSLWDYDDRPAPTALNINSAGILCVLDNTTNLAWSVNVVAGNYDVYNLIPSHIYHYWVLDSNNNTVQAGIFSPVTGAIRDIYVDGNVRNVRDFGGKSADGGSIKFGLLYRGSEFDGSHGFGITSTGIWQLTQQCGVRADVDIRESIGVTQSPLGANINYINIPLPDAFPNYSYIIDLNRPEYYKQTIAILNAVMQNVVNGNPVYLHCTYGADRTATIAYLIESLLGVNGIVCDIDYELTTFAYGGSSHIRTTTQWIRLVNALAAYSGNTTRDKVIDFIKKAGGLQAKLVNDFRAKIIDGTPETITWNQTITKNMTNCSISGGNTVANGADYNATITPNSGYELQSVVVQMGGVDITSSSYSDGVINIQDVSGDIVITAIASSNAASVTYNLTNVTSSNSAMSAAIGQSYTTTLSVESGLGMSVTVAMGGTDITSSAYNSSNNTVTIQSVSGNIVITASAVYPVTPTLTWNRGKNLSYVDGVTVTDSNQYAYNDWLPIDANATYTSTMPQVFNDDNYRVLCYDSNKNYLGVGFAQQKNGSSWKVSTKYTNCAYVRFRLYANNLTNMNAECDGFVLTKN